MQRYIDIFRNLLQIFEKNIINILFEVKYALIFVGIINISD